MHATKKKKKRAKRIKFSITVMTQSLSGKQCSRIRIDRLTVAVHMCNERTLLTASGHMQVVRDWENSKM